MWGYALYTETSNHSPPPKKKIKSFKKKKSSVVAGCCEMLVCLPKRHCVSPLTTCHRFAITGSVPDSNWYPTA